MKKILILVVLLFPLSVMAIENVIYKDHGYYLCDENGAAYHLYEIKYKSTPLFPLNYTTRLNFDFNSYEQVSYEESPYIKDIQDYLWITPLVNHISIYNYYYQIVTRFLWENLYPEKDFYFCNESTLSLNSKEEVYKTVIERVENVLYGSEIMDENHYQTSGEEKTYQDESFKFYYLSDANGLEATLEGDTLKVKGKAGEYNLVFKIKGNMSSSYNELYSDGNNYLAMYPKQPDYEYFMNIVIESIPLSISFEDNILDENLCLSVYQDEKFITKSCIDNDKKINFDLDKGHYSLKLLDNDYYADYEETIDLNDEMNISLELKDKETKDEVLENQDETLTELNENSIYVNINADYLTDDLITFIPKNTYKSSSIIIIFILFSYYVIYKKK